MDPTTISVVLSGVAAASAALAAAFAAAGALRPKRDLSVADALDALRDDLGRLHVALTDGMRSGREDTGTHARHMREEVAAVVARLGEATGQRLEAMRRGGDESGRALREEVAAQVRGFGDLLGRTLEASGASQKERLEDVAGTVRRLTEAHAGAHEGLRQAVEGRLETLRQGNEAKLEEMRRTVDEKLHGTLEQRLGDSFKLVSERLDTVHRGLGEMQSLATGVGDLKRVLTNVKTRGTWAEVSLGALLDQVLTAEQFGRNVETVRGTNARVEYAVRLPGAGPDETVWLPIDAKFPIEDYERVAAAADGVDPAAVEQALASLERQIKLEGAKICAKYISAPETTDFAIMYLPTEGLYAEVLRRPGLVDHLQTRCKVMVAGPTNLHAFLTTLRMGFRTLTIQQRSAEVWKVLGAAKTEFGKYGDVLDRVKKNLDLASRQMEDVSQRTRAVERRLRGVEAVPEGEAASLLALEPLERPTGLLDAAE